MKRQPKTLKRTSGKKPLTELRILKKEVEVYEIEGVVFLMRGMIENARRAIKANDLHKAGEYLEKALAFGKKK